MILYALLYLLQIFVGSFVQQNQNLIAITTNTRLPTKLGFSPTVYDGDDSIYLVGGSTGDQGPLSYKILKYSISSETIESVAEGTMVPVGGSAVWAGDNNVLYFGGGSSGTEMDSKTWSFKTSNPNKWSLIGNLPEKCVLPSSVWDQRDNTYIIGGVWDNRTIVYLDTISRYSNVTKTIDVVGQLPTGRCAVSVIQDTSTDDIYIFGGEDEESRPGGLRDILKFDPSDGSVIKLNVTLFRGIARTCAVWTGREAYIIGGWFEDVDANITRFNPSKNEVEDIVVRNLPTLYGHGCIFVEKLNRIYIFGGGGIDESYYRDEIMYIQLD